MILSVSISVPLDTREPREAIRTFTDLVLNATAPGAAPQLTLLLLARSNPGVIVRLARALPEDAVAFTLGTGPKVTARQLLAGATTKVPLTTFSGPIPSLATLEDLLSESPAAVRATSFSVYARGLRVKGAPEDTQGEIVLQDSKVLKRKVRFEIGAVLRWRGAGAGDRANAAMLKMVSAQTGLDFSRAKVFAASEPAATAPSRDQTLAFEVGFQEALERAGAELRRRGVAWRELPGLAPRAGPDSVGSRRFAAYLAGRREKVDLVPLLKRAGKAALPEYRARADGEAVELQKPIADGLEVLVTFLRLHLSGFGKAFEVELGVLPTSGPLSGYRRSDGLFRLFQARMLAWSYTTKEELLAELDGVLALLREVLPVVEGWWARLIDPRDPSLPADLTRRGAITARQALPDARALAREWAADAALTTVVAYPLTLVRDQTKEPSVGPDGRLREHGTWSFIFHSRSRGESAWVVVAALGSAQRIAWTVDPAWPVAELPDEWIDSDRAVTIAEEHGGRAARVSGVTVFDVLPRLAVDDGRARWQVHYLIVDGLNRADVRIALAAADGGDVEVMRA